MASGTQAIVATVGTDHKGFSFAELAAAAGTTVATVSRLIRLGLLDAGNEGSVGFTPATATRLRRMLRLHRDLGANMVGASIILDLVERVEHLQSELSRKRRFP